MTTLLILKCYYRHPCLSALRLPRPQSPPVSKTKQIYPSHLGASTCAGGPQTAHCAPAIAIGVTVFDFWHDSRKIDHTRSHHTIHPYFGLLRGISIHLPANPKFWTHPTSPTTAAALAPWCPPLFLCSPMHPRPLRLPPTRRLVWLPALLI